MKIYTITEIPLIQSVSAIGNMTEFARCDCCKT